MTPRIQPHSGPSFEAIVAHVMALTGMCGADLGGDSRAEMAVLARGLVGLFSHERCGMSYPEIAARLSGAGHSTFVESARRTRRELEAAEALLVTLKQEEAA